jgi:hypothetical protein
MEESEELGPAAAYSASVAEWLNQAYHAHMIQVREYRTQWGPSFLPVVWFGSSPTSVADPHPHQNGKQDSHKSEKAEVLEGHFGAWEGQI